MNVQFPEFLWLLPLVALVWLVPRRGLQWQHAALRSLVVLLLVFGLARPVLVSASWTDHHVVIVDRSASQFDQVAVDQSLRSVLDALPDGGIRVLLEVGASEGLEQSSSLAGVESFDERIEIASEHASPLGRALWRALRAIPAGSGGAVTLISDGMATDSRWQRAVQELTRRRLPLHVVKSPSASDDVRVVGLQGLDELRVGHVGRVRITVASSDASVQASLLADGIEVAQSRELRCEGITRIELPFEPSEAGFVSLVAKVVRTDAADSDGSNNSLQRMVAVQEPLRVLYIGSRVQDAASHLSQLLGNGFALREPSNGQSLNLEHTDLTMLDDRPADQVPDSWQQAIAQAVQTRGMGLFVSGGRSAFGPGGYHDTVIEEISPVEYVQKEEKKDPSTTLSIVIDTSGSMVGNRMTLAKEIARLAIRRLQPHDKVGIVEFYGTKQWAAPIQSAANSIDLQRALNRLGAAGGTVLFPAVEESYYALQNVKTRYKHVLIVTDAGVETGPYEALLRSMSDDGIAVSTVLVGPGRHSEFLVELADWGGGRYYHSPDRFNLPELLLKKPSTSMLPPYRPGEFQLESRGGRGWWGDVDSDSMPPIETLVETSLRPGADLLLSVAGSSRPVMASWQYGLGRVTSLSTEPVGPGTRKWGEWPGYGPMLGRVLSRTARSSQPPFSVTTRRDGVRLHIELRREVRAKVIPQLQVLARPGQEVTLSEVSLREVAPGVFQGALVAAMTDSVRLMASTVGGWQHRICSDALSARAPETQVDPRFALPMAKIAAASGGQHVAAGQKVPPLKVSRIGAPMQIVALWPWLLLLALVLYVLDVWHRRRSFATRRLA